MRFVLGTLGLLSVLAAHCALREVPDASRSQDAGPAPEVKTLRVPQGFALHHMGEGDDLRRLVGHMDPDLLAKWTEGSLVTLRRGSESCAYMRLGAKMTPLRACSDATKPDAGAWVTLELEPHRFGRPLVDGVVPFEGLQAEGRVVVPRSLLLQYLQPVGLPLVATADAVDVLVSGAEDGSGLCLAFELKSDVLGPLGRFDLTRRYGGFADYVHSVRAWGDGKHFQWMTRLDGGGAGMRLDGRKVRLAVQAGAEWEQGLDALLRGSKAAWVPLPVLAVEGLVADAAPGQGWRLRAPEKPLPTRSLLRQLAARLARWTAKTEEQQ